MCSRRRNITRKRRALAVRVRWPVDPMASCRRGDGRWKDRVAAADRRRQIRADTKSYRRTEPVRGRFSRRGPNIIQYLCLFVVGGFPGPASVLPSVRPPPSLPASGCVLPSAGRLTAHRRLLRTLATGQLGRGAGGGERTDGSEGRGRMKPTTRRTRNARRRETM